MSSEHSILLLPNNPTRPHAGILCWFGFAFGACQEYDGQSLYDSIAGHVAFRDDGDVLRMQASSAPRALAEARTCGISWILLRAPAATTQTYRFVSEDGQLLLYPLARLDATRAGRASPSVLAAPLISFGPSVCFPVAEFERRMRNMQGMRVADAKRPEPKEEAPKD